MTLPAHHASAARLKWRCERYKRLVRHHITRISAALTANGCAAARNAVPLQLVVVCPFEISIHLCSSKSHAMHAARLVLHRYEATGEAEMLLASSGRSSTGGNGQASCCLGAISRPSHRISSMRAVTQRSVSVTHLISIPRWPFAGPDSYPGPPWLRHHACLQET